MSRAAGELKNTRTLRRGGIGKGSTLFLDFRKDILLNSEATRKLSERRDGADMSDILEELRGKARDNARTPMQVSHQLHGIPY